MKDPMQKWPRNLLKFRDAALVFVACILLLWPLNGFSVDQEALVLYDEGLRSAFLGDQEKAISAFQSAVAIDGTLADAHAYLGILHGIRGYWKEAIQSFQAAIKTDPNYLEVYGELGEAYLNALGSVDKSIPLLQKAVHLHPNDERARRLLGIAYLRQNRIDESKIQLQQALELNPTHPESIYNLGLACFRKGEFKAASLHFSHLLEDNPLHAQGYFNLGNCFVRTGNYADAKKALLTFEKLRVQGEQIKQLELMVRRRPRDPEGWRQLGLLHLERREWDTATTALERCVALNPEEDRCSEALGYVYAQLKRYKKALQIYSRIVQRRPDMPEYRHSLGLVYYMLGYVSEAILEFEAAIGLNPTNSRFYASLAKAYKRSGADTRSVETYQRYQELQSQNK